MSARLEEAVPPVRRLLGLDRDVAGAVAALRDDAVLGPLVRENPGVRPCGAWSEWEATVRAVVGQQVSVAGARPVLGRLLDGEGRLPSPAALAGLPLDAFPMPRTRARALQALATLDWSDGPDELVDALLGVPGIGPWTVAYVRLRGLGDDDAWPGTDLVLRRAVTETGAEPEAWRPWRAWGATHLWNRPGAQARAHRAAVGLEP